MATAKKGPSSSKGSSEKKSAGSSASSDSPASAKPKEPSSKPKESSSKPKVEDAASQLLAPGYSDNIRLGAEGPALFMKAAGLAVVCLGLAAALGASEGDGFKRFSHAYLVGYAVALAVSAGSLYWITLQHLVNSHWSIVVRRIAEVFAANAPLMGVLALPIVIPVLAGSPLIYEWADHAKVEADHLLHHKAPYLNPTFFAIRMIVYFGFWTLLSRFFLKGSLKMDETGSTETLAGMRKVAGPAMILFGLTLTFCAFDLLMSVDAHWFSTIFGVYFFASCVICVHATLGLSALWLQGKGRLKSVTTEHFHDIGKMLFAFTVFWAYVGFSQFMLIWYANIPEETIWYKERFAGGWGTWSWILLFGHFVFPFFGLLSRHVKRNRTGLAFFAVWMVVMVYMDMYWLVMPSIDHEPHLQLVDFLCVIGLLSALVAGAAQRAGKLNLLPTKDPRLPRSLAFENI
jgi:hypothetical protein